MDWVLVVFAILIVGGAAAFFLLQKNGTKKDIRQIGPTTQDRPTVSVGKGGDNPARMKANTAKTAQLSALRDRLAAGGASAGAAAGPAAGKPTPAATIAPSAPTPAPAVAPSGETAEKSWSPEEAGLETSGFVLVSERDSQRAAEVSGHFQPPEILDPSITLQTPMETAAPDAEKPAQPKKTTAEKIKILLVDDSKVVRVKTEKLLQSNGYEVLSAVDGLDAIAKLETFWPEAIITDIEMPNLDGFGLVRNVRANEKTSKIPIIVMTSHVNLHLDIAATEGINGFLPKPFNEQDLLDQVAFLVE